MSTTIILDPSLTPRIFGPDDRYKPSCIDRVRSIQDIAADAKIDPNTWVRGHLPGTLYHANYLTYLEVCWANHYTPVVSPDILWFGLLNEVASIIRDNPEAVRELFSTSKEKQKIIVPTGDPEVIPLDLIIDQLKGLVPGGIEGYLPTFSTTTLNSRFAHYAAFCDAVSPYYDYCMFMCGFPAIKILGTIDDYVRLAEAWRQLPKLLVAQAPAFFAQAQKVLEELVVALHGARGETDIGKEAAREWFGTIFAAKKCGSGHQTEVNGWITKLQRKQPKGPRYASNFEPQIAKVEYNELTTNREFVMLYGLFSSELVDGVAIPTFAPLVFEPKMTADAKDARTLAQIALSV
jgi:hypothetical protein